MDGTGSSLITAFDYVWGRLTERLGRLTDEEYFWEPVPGCWSLRQDGQGRWRLDGGGGGGPAPDPAPVTTIAWRLGHLGGMAVGGFASRRFGDGSLTAARIRFPARADDGLLEEDEAGREERGGLPRRQAAARVQAGMRPAALGGVGLPGQQAAVRDRGGRRGEGRCQPEAGAQHQRVRARSRGPGRQVR